MGNILKSFATTERSQKSTNTVIYVSNKTTPARCEQTTSKKMTQLKQPKKAGLFQAKKSTTSIAPHSEVDRIIAGMQRNA